MADFEVFETADLEFEIPDFELEMPDPDTFDEGAEGIGGAKV